MQKFLTKYWLAFQVIVLFVAVSLSIFHTGGKGAVYLLWVSLFAVESLLLLPTVFKDESLADARKRVSRALESDAFTYVGVVMVSIVCIQWLNSGCNLVYLPDADIWKFSMPPVEWMPYSVEPMPARVLLTLVISVFAGGLVIRNGLGKGGKRFFIDAATIISGMMAAYAVAKYYAGVMSYTKWATHPGAANPGTFFAFWFMISLGRDLSGSRSRTSTGWSALWWMFAVIGNLIGLVQFSSALNLVIYLVIGLLLFSYRLVMLTAQRVPLAQQFRFFMGMLVAVALVAGTVMFAVPKSPVIPKIMALQDKTYFENIIANRDFRMTAAFKIWEDAPWTGVGANGFHHYLGTVIEDGEWKLTKQDKYFVWNDGFQFLCEWGVIGTGVLAAMIITLCIPLFVRFRMLFSSHNEGDSARDVLLKLDDYIVPCVVVTLMVLLEGWFSSPFQSSALFISWFYVLAVLPGLLPTKKVKHF